MLTNSIFIGWLLVLTLARVPFRLVPFFKNSKSYSMGWRQGQHSSCQHWQISPITIGLDFRKCNTTHYPKIKNNTRHNLKSNTFIEQGAKKRPGYSKTTDSGLSECNNTNSDWPKSEETYWQADRVKRRVPGVNTSHLPKQ
jgi:hypothetical protein